MRAFSGARCRDCPVKMPEAGMFFFALSGLQDPQGIVSGFRKQAAKMRDHSSHVEEFFQHGYIINSFKRIRFAFVLFSDLWTWAFYCRLFRFHFQHSFSTPRGSILSHQAVRDNRTVSLYCVMVIFCDLPVQKGQREILFLT